MGASLTDIDSERRMLGAPGAFALPHVLQNTTPDVSSAVSLNVSGGQQQQQQGQQAPSSQRQRQEPSGRQGKSPPHATQPDANPRIAGWSNSGSLGAVEPNLLGITATTALDSTVTSSAVAPSEARSTPASEVKEDGPQCVHVLVVFDRSFCVCFVPATLRSTVKVGELVLCECAHGENIGTVVADMTSLIAEVMQQRESATSAAAVAEAFTPPCEHIVSAAGGPSAATSAGGHPGGSLIATTAMYAEKAGSGLPADHLLRRLPCVLRRGTNRDKKRLYFARLRSNDALAAVHRMLRSEPLIAQSAEYHVSFASVSIYLAGERRQCPWTPSQFEQLGVALAEPLRSETVEFRFVSDQHHDELDLTRGVTGAGLCEMLYGVVAEHHERQGGRGGPGNRGGAGRGATAGRAPPQLLPARMSKVEGHIISGPPGIMAAYGGHPVWTQTSAALPAGAYITQAVSPPQQQQHQQTLGYTIAPYVYMSPPQQQHQQHHVQAIPVATAQQPAQTLPFVQVHYPTPAAQTNTAPGIYWANVPHAQQPPQPLDSPPQVSVSPAHGLAGEPAYYYMMSPTQPQQATAPPAGPTYVHAAAPTQQPTFVQLPMLNTQGIQGVSYPFVLPSNTGSFPH